MKFTTLVTIGISLLTLNSQADETEKIIGQNDLVLVNAQASNIPAKYRTLVNAFGIVSMGCTATHIGGGYVLTAGHCFEAPPDVVRNQECSDTTITWGVRDGATPTLTSKCEKIIAAQLNEGSDFALLKVSPAPRVSVGVELSRQVAPGTQVTIFSHPNMEPLQWSKTCVVESPTSNSGGVNLPAKALRHTCDTNPGSSGATILNANTRKVVAIHDGGALSAPGVGMNYGTYLSSPGVSAALRSVGFR